MRSIRARLLASIGAIQVLAAILATYLVVVHDRRESYIAFDAGLSEQAAVLRSLIEAPDDDRGETFTFHREFLSLPRGARYFIADAGKKSIATSPGWSPPQPLPGQDRNIVEFSSGSTRYRALVLRRVPMEDSEFEGGPVPRLTLVYAAPVAPVELHIQNVEYRAFGACLALLGVVTAITASAITRGLRPVRDLASNAARIDVNQWTLPEIEKSRQVPELAALAAALGNLVDRLHAAFERERQFFGDAAHELKSSVAIIRSTLQLSLQADRTAAEYKAGLESALADTNRLQNLVVSMLNLARIESGETELRSEPAAAEANAQAQQVAQRLRPLAEEKGVAIVLEETPREAWVSISDEDLFAILSNLVENAIHHSGEGQRITVSLLAAKDVCSISVIDKGSGIAQAVLPHIFDRFVRGDQSRSRSSGGAGLGLSIARALVVRAKGSISVQSESGKGTTFSVVLPLSRESALLSSPSIGASLRF